MTVSNENTRYELFTPLNEWDTNYRVYDSKKGITYLIDCHDVYDNDNTEEIEKYGGILYQDLLNIEIEEIKNIAWKIESDKL